MQRPVQVDDELHFLTDWEALHDRPRTRIARLTSVLLHVAAVLTWFLLPKSVTAPITAAVERQITPLIAPLTELTQREPSPGKVSKEFNLPSPPARPRLHIPPSPPPGPIRKLAPPPAAKPAPAGAPNLPDAPKVQAAQQAPQVNVPNLPQMAPPLQIQTQEKPKLALENLPGPPTGPGNGKLAAPSTSVNDALRSVIRGSGAGGLEVGDPGAMSPGSIGGPNAPQLPGKPGAGLKLLNDPQGADFYPYLVQMLATLKRSWFAVWPESAKLGRQGRVVIQFIVDRNGLVPKLVIASGSGTDALDKAAVAAISASVRQFPQFPTGYKGNDIRLQLNFVYNMK